MSKVKPRLAARQNILFNYAAGLLLIPFITKRGGKIALIIDKQTAHVTSGFRIKDFLEYKIWYEVGRPDIDLAIQLLEDEASYGLQAADVVFNTIYRYLNGKSQRAYKLIEGKIKEEKRLFF